MGNQVPNGWVETTLESLVSKEGVFSDGDWVESKDQDSSGDVRLTQLADIGDMRFIDKSNRYMTSKKADAMKCLYLKKDDLLISRLGDPLGKACLYPGNESKAVTVVDVCVFRPGHSYVDVKLVGYFLNSMFMRSLIDEQASGTTRKRITGKKIKALPFRLPPLNEQKRILDRIEQLFSDMDKGEELLKTVQKQLATYRQSVLKAAVTGELTKDWREKNKKDLETGSALLSRIKKECKSRVKNWKPVKGEQEDASLFPQVPDEWAIERLGNLDINIFDGPFGSNLKTSDYTDSGVRVIRLENIGRGFFIDKKQSFISKKKYETLKRHTVVPKDIVFSSFVTDAIRSTLIPEHISFAVNKADCFCIRFFGETIGPEFVQYFLQSQSAFRQVEGMIHGVGRPRINTTQLKDVMIPICCLKEQEEIISRIEDIFSQIDAFESLCAAELKRSTTLRQSILKSAFSGQLVAQDPADEPASELLARIKSGDSPKTKAKTATSRRGRKPRSDKSEAA